MTSPATRATQTAAFRKACGQFATGVTAVTAAAPDGRIAAITANSFTSVSLEPQLVSVCIGSRLPSMEVFAAASHVAIHVLTGDQEEVARRCATGGLSGAERLAGLRWAAGDGGVPLIADCAARFAGKVYDRLPAGDHVIVLVHVDDLYLPAEETSSLLFHRGQFGVIPPPEEAGKP